MWIIYHTLEYDFHPFLNLDFLFASRSSKEKCKKKLEYNFLMKCKHVLDVDHVSKFRVTIM